VRYDVKLSKPTVRVYNAHGVSECGLINGTVSCVLVYQRDALRSKKDLSIREDLFYVMYEARLKEQMNIQHVKQYSTIRPQHNDKMGRGLAREYYGSRPRPLYLR
jgi:hypothetical protein